MDDNKQIFDFYGYNYNPLDVNNWMIYPQQYFNFPSFDLYSGGLGLNYANVTLQNNYNQSYPTNISQQMSNIPYKGKQTNFHSHKSENKRHTKQNTVETPKRPDKSFRVPPDNITHTDHSYKPSKTDNTDKPHNAPSKTFEILNRNKKIDEEKFRKAFLTPSKTIDFNEDFPPISGRSINVEINNDSVAKSLDFKLALQKPKPIPIDDKTNKENSIQLSQREEIFEKGKKKRVRKRKKKAAEKQQPQEQQPVKQFSLIDEEFPCLDIVKIEEKHVDRGDAIATEETTVINKVTTTLQRKKYKKRNLLFILSGGLEGQVRVIEAPKAQKTKTKRKLHQDRMKRPIGMLNPLDLSAPTVKRGKERLKPKIKKPSKLKKAILNCRSLKKEMREKANLISKEISEINNLEKRVEIDVIEKKQENLVSRIHSKNFREYCNHMIDNKINSIISQLLKTLVGFQDKLHNRDPVKAKLKRRLCFGLREVTKFVNMKKLRLIIIAPDLEKIEIEGGLDDIVSVIIKAARESGIPYVFGLSRSSLAYLCYKKFRVGAIGIFNYDGAEAQVKDLLTSVDQARDQYNQIKQIMESISQDASVFPRSLDTVDPYFSPNKPDLFTPCNNYTPFNSGHSRTPSNALSEPLSDIGEMNKLLFNSIIEDQSKATNSNSEIDEYQLNGETSDGKNDDETEDKLIDEYVENILHSVSRISLNTDNL